jgi:hypothetical protein
VSDPSNPSTVSSLEILDNSLEHGDASGIHVSGNYAYVAGYKGRLSIVDISNPYDPVQVDSIKSVIAYSIFVTEKNTYLIDNNYGMFIFDTGVTKIDHYDRGILPKCFALYQNYPNPFNPKTNIQFSIPKTEFISLKIYNLLGQEVTTLVSDRLTAGSYSYDWDASKVASGLYLYRLETEGYAETKKMILMK